MTQPERTGTCPWCGKKRVPLFKTTALMPLKTKDEDVTVITEYVCASCFTDERAERFWLKRMIKKAEGNSHD